MSRVMRAWSARLLVLCLLVLSLGMAGRAAAAAVPVPAWTAPVMDLSQTLTAGQIRTLADQARVLQRDIGSQLFVLLVHTTGTESIEQYARRVFDQWRVGREGVDDGVLLLVAVQDRRLRIEVGYGLEGAVTDIAAGRIIREQIAPQFAQDHFFDGVQAGVSALETLMRGEALPPPPEASGNEDAEPYLMLFPLALMALVAPWWVGMVFLGAFAFLLTNSVLWAVLGAVGGALLVIVGHVTGMTQWLRRRGLSVRRRRSRDDGPGGFGGGMGDGPSGGGSSGGGGGGGGGGSGGGGGASGNW